MNPPKGTQELVEHLRACGRAAGGLASSHGGPIWVPHSLPYFDASRQLARPMASEVKKVLFTSLLSPASLIK